MAKLISVLALLTALAGQAQLAFAASGDEIHFELNQAQTIDGTCRVTLLVRNDLPHDLGAFSVDLVIFDANSGVSGYAGLDLGALPKGKTLVQQYDLIEDSCENVSRLLVNNVRACEGAPESPAACLSALRLKSRAAIDLFL